jgi:TRAP-type uncharacterized transport system substrate-binding protein
MRIALAAVLAACATAASADFNDKKPINATITGATPSGYPRTMVEGLNAVVRDTYPGSAVSFKPNSPGGGVVAIAEKQADFTATATGTEIRLANEGRDPYKSSLKGKFSYVMMLYDNQYMHFVMTKEWADANGIKSWADIAAKKPKMRLAINRPDNPQTTIGGPYEVMKAYGFTINDIAKWGGSYVLGNSQIGLDALTDDKADVFMNARNLGDSLLKMWRASGRSFGSTATCSACRRPPMRSTSRPPWCRRAPIRSWRRTTRRSSCGFRFSLGRTYRMKWSTST